MLTRLFHIVLSLLLLAGANGVLVQQHYCQGALQAARLFAKAPSCHAPATVHSCCQMPTSLEAAPSCPHHASDSSDGCCDDRAEYLQLDEQYTQVSPSVFSLEKSETSAVLASRQTWTEAPVSAPVAYLHYRPPLITIDRVQLYGQFLC